MSRLEKLARWLYARDVRKGVVGDPFGGLATEYANDAAAALVAVFTQSQGEGEATQWQKQRTQILDALDHAHEYETPMALAASIRAILSLP